MKHTYKKYAACKRPILIRMDELYAMIPKNGLTEEIKKELDELEKKFLIINNV